MDPALKDIIYAGLWAVVGLVGTILGSAALVFRMLRSTIEDQNKKIAECEKKHKDTEDRLKGLAATCPITNQPCPLRNLYS